MEKLKTVFDWSARLVLAAVFLYAGVVKFMRPDAFFRDISNYQILPEILSYAAAYFMPAFEIFAAFALLSRRFVSAGLVCICGMLAVFMVAIFSAWVRGLDISCGCFGSGDVSGYAETMARDAGLIILCIIIFLLNCNKFIKSG